MRASINSAAQEVTRHKNPVNARKKLHRVPLPPTAPGGRTPTGTFPFPIILAAAFGVVAQAGITPPVIPAAAQQRLPARREAESRVCDTSSCGGGGSKSNRAVWSARPSAAAC